ncbi:MAG TPA: DNA translocase FtsK 4TM domain-containing protein, partial [bacterium]|nr:DNA translocase FtsK 4TM domain-containing protein [bacterium]
MSRNRKLKKFFMLSRELQRSLSVILLFILAIASFLSFFNIAGAFGRFINHYYSILFGWGKFVFAALLLLLSVFLYWHNYKNNRVNLRFAHYFGAFLLILNSCGLATYWVWLHLPLADAGALIDKIALYQGGGYLGFVGMIVLVKFVGNILAGIILASLLLIGVMLTFQTSLNQLIKKTYVIEWLAKGIWWFLVSVAGLFATLFTAIGDKLSKRGEKAAEAEDDDATTDEDADFDADGEPAVAEMVNRKLELDDGLAESNAEFVDLNDGAEEEMESEDEASDEEGTDDDEEIVGVPVFEASESQLLKKDQHEIADNELLFPYQTDEILQYQQELSVDILEKPSAKPQNEDIKTRSQQIKKTLQNFGIEVEMKDVKVGPVVTQFSVKPAEGIKLSRITALQDDLSLALAAYPLRIEAPIPGKPYVGLEVPNKQTTIVRLKPMLESEEYTHRKNNLQIALGQDVAGKTWFADISKMPHMLVAGQTGSGKSVCLNAIIISLLYQNQPSDLRFIMVDPKRVELTLYNGIPHLLTPVITDVPRTLNAFKWTVAEMERRYTILSKFGKRDIASYNTIAQEKMPYLVFIIDELSDIMLTAGRDVEAYIVRLTQMARAVGIHLVIATQRPSVNVITGLIKANIPARIAFSVASNTDSRTILDKAGAEKLLGKGDMLFQDPSESEPRRIQGVYISDEEVKRAALTLKENLETPIAYPEEIVNNDSGHDINPGERTFGA